MLKVLLVVLRILLTLLPELLNRAAEDKATDAINNVYSMRSWPPSSRQKPPIKHTNSLNLDCCAIQNQLTFFGRWLQCCVWFTAAYCIW